MDMIFRAVCVIVLSTFNLRKESVGVENPGLRFVVRWNRGFKLSYLGEDSPIFLSGTTKK